MQAQAKFPLGRLVATASVIVEVPESEIKEALARHVQGDWGELEPSDMRENEWALKHGERLLSAYRSSEGTKFWIITERDRSATTVLLPSDY